MTCRCGHEHLTTRGPCVRFDVCVCRTYAEDLDPPHLVYRRRRDLIAAVKACPHTADEIQSTTPRHYPERLIARPTERSA